MQAPQKTLITVEVTISAEPEHVWECWTQPEHIMKWNFASPDWCCPAATNDLRVGGAFSWRMEAKDGSMGFDYSGSYEDVMPISRIEVRLDDDREVKIYFEPNEDGVHVIETFEIEDQNSADMQRAGWQAILDNFKKHAESS